MKEDESVNKSLPTLCVDLDGTIIKSDTLIELFLSAWGKDFLLPLRCAYWLLGGKAALKDILTQRTHVDVEIFPYNELFIDYLRQQKMSGRNLVLVTACNIRLAERVADHLGLFNEVMASNAQENLRGPQKAAKLTARFQAQNFAYAGNDATDLAVWAVAHSAVVVNAPPGLIARVPCPIEAEFPRKKAWWKILPKAMRLLQWAKNFLVFIPITVSDQAINLQSFIATVVTFFIFGLTASGVYLINDLVDLDADRRHADKCQRPLANGELPLLVGLSLGHGLIAFSMLAAFYFDLNLFYVLMLYIVITSSYTFYFKSQPLIDVFILAVLFTLRIYAGIVVTHSAVSVWLLSFSGTIFLSLAFLKRSIELTAQNNPASIKINRRGYFPREKILLTIMGVASAFSSAIILSIYVDSNMAHHIYLHPNYLWAIVPLLLFWLCRIWFQAERGQIRHDPVEFAIHDPYTWCIALSVVYCYLSARGF